MKINEQSINFILQLVRPVIMVKTVWVFAPLTAGCVTTLTEHVDVSLDGENPTVLLVFVS